MPCACTGLFDGFCIHPCFIRDDFFRLFQPEDLLQQACDLLLVLFVQGLD